MNQICVKFLLVSAAALGLSGCALSPRSTNPPPERPLTTAQPAQMGDSIYVTQRALPTRTDNVLQPAHYQHVYVDDLDPAAVTVQTITLADAVKNNVLASSDFEVKRLSPVDPATLRWVVLENDFNRPSELEGVAGAAVRKNSFAALYFNIGQSEILNRKALDELVQVASRVDGIFHVVGFADATGLEAKNQTLSADRAKAVAEYIAAGGVHPSRINAVGAGVSRTFAALEENRRVSVSFRVLSK